VTVPGFLHFHAGRPMERGFDSRLLLTRAVGFRTEAHQEEGTCALVASGTAEPGSLSTVQPHGLLNRSPIGLAVSLLITNLNIPILKPDRTDQWPTRCDRFESGNAQCAMSNVLDLLVAQYGAD
jgi:hypothetical protein